MVDTSACRLYELYAAAHGSSGWTAGSGATWDLRSNTLRPAGWTSADAAGLPIFPGLVRYDEVAAGAILHALRFTAPSTCAGYIYPAAPPGRQRLLRARSRRWASGSASRRRSNISGFGPQARVVLRPSRRTA